MRIMVCWLDWAGKWQSQAIEARILFYHFESRMYMVEYTWLDVPKYVETVFRIGGKLYNTQFEYGDTTRIVLIKEI